MLVAKLGQAVAAQDTSERPAETSAGAAGERADGPWGQAAGQGAGARGRERWMQGSSGPLRGVLLSLVLERPGSGGELASRLVARIGETWRVQGKDVYRLLDGLDREGLICARQQPRRGNDRRMRVVYHPTERTQAALHEWMDTITPHEPLRSGLLAKLVASTPADARRFTFALEQHQRECLALAEMVVPSEVPGRSWTALCINARREAIYAALQAEIAWADRTLRSIHEYVALDSP